MLILQQDKDQAERESGFLLQNSSRKFLLETVQIYPVNPGIFHCTGYCYYGSMEMYTTKYKSNAV